MYDGPAPSSPWAFEFGFLVSSGLVCNKARFVYWFVIYKKYLGAPTVIPRQRCNNH